MRLFYTIALVAPALSLNPASAQVTQPKPGISVVVKKHAVAIDPLKTDINDTSADVIFDGGTYVLDRPNLVIVAHSIQFLHGATLVAGNANVVLDTRELRSDHGSIVSYTQAASMPLDAAAGANGTPGGNGAVVSIVAHTIVIDGDKPFIVNASGQQGGNGVKGATGAKGAPGTQGPSGFIMRRTDPDTPHSPAMWDCEREPGRGGDGGTGVTGGAGGLGGMGGSGGNVVIRLGSSSQLGRIGASAHGGHGGFGGAGGIGGDPGDPGPAGIGHSPCAPDGGLGGPGHQGDGGTDHSKEQAKDGIAGQVDIQMGNPAKSNRHTKRQ